MTASETSQVWRVVWRRMGEWEADDGEGSARPVFIAAWAAATRTLTEPATPHEFETAWRAWLEAGAPLTAERAVALLDAAGTRGHAGELFADTALRQGRPPLRLLRREPGEDG
jgi:hypothetical protein